MTVSMMSILLLMCSLLLVRSFPSVRDSLSDEFWKQRNATLATENINRIGGQLKLTDDEQKVNDKLTQFKIEDIAKGQKNGYFPPSEHFFFAKETIDNSEVLRIIKQMPKGGALHLHDTSMTDVHWLINKTYSDNCYMCYKNGLPAFKFFDKPRQDPDCDHPWKTVNYFRKLYNSSAKFDEKLYQLMTMYSKDPFADYPTQGKIWQKFYSCFAVAGGLINYAPLFREYYYEALQEFYNDNVQYLEFRVLLPEIYELNGTTYDKDYVINLYKQTTDDFMKTHPDFIGAKIIYSSARLVNTSIITTKVQETIKYMNKYKGFFLGFDLVGREDAGFPLTNFLDALLYPQRQTPPVKVPYFFHAGETDWEGTSIDDNLVSAVLLNTSRIGHGYALLKHPKVMEMVKAKGIAIEVNPISNQVLGLVDDLRNHPGSVLFSQDMPVVISSDDPALWGSLPLSHDFYEAFMGLAGEQGDLRTLKQLAINSILYSGMTVEEKPYALKHLLTKWDQFIANMITHYKL